MKNRIQGIIYLCLATGINLFIQSCVNHISENEETAPVVGDILISVSDNSLHEQLYQNDCEEAIGVYVLTAPLNKERYIENTRFYCTASGFKSDQDIFYPAEESKCNFISYFPYQEAGILSGECNMPIKINNNQATDPNYISSDFMTAEADNIKVGKTNVELTHVHRLCQLSIILSPLEGNNIESLKANNPVITINNVPTKTLYNFETEEFTTFSNFQNISPYGEWEIHNGTLTGKKCILIPQVITANTEFLTLDINGKSYACQLPRNYQLKSGTNCEIELLYDPQKGISCITPKINDWKQGNQIEVTPEEKLEKSYITISDFDFQKSNVYSVLHKEKIIAEVCKEYLLAENIQTQAIVIYPVKNGVSDWANGKVLCIQGTENRQKGGHVQWNTQTNQLIFTSSEQPLTSGFYISTELAITTIPPAEPLLLSIREKTLLDNRGNETNVYPIVKIATQYWMRENLKTTIYNDGKKITLKTKSNYSKTSAGYFNEKSSFFYNRKAVISGKLAPSEWKIADEKSWQQLKTYINGNASVLKCISNLWQPAEFSANNFTGFSALPVGFLTKGKETDTSIYGFDKQYVAYWSMGNTTNTLSENGILLRYDSNEIKGATYSDYCGYSIRCVKL